jgi:hypothetical protein
VSDLPDDLRTTIDVWESLSMAMKAGIMIMVKVAQ